MTIHPPALYINSRTRRALLSKRYPTPGKLQKKIMESHYWAKVTAGHIARFGELTKREIQVLSFLFLCRNGSDLRCNPKRSTICAGLGWPPEYRSHVSAAIKGLEKKGWIFEEPDGDFYLFDAADIPAVADRFPGDADGPFVTKSVTNPPVENSEENPDVTKSVTPEIVTKSVTIDTKSVTNCYQIGNDIYKDLEQRKNRERTERAPRKSRKKLNPLKFAKPVPIPEPFELTDEMIDWIAEHCPGLRVADAMADFLEYWTNKARGKNALAKNWRLRWEKGMRMILTWQKRDAAADAANGPADWRSVGKAIPDPNAAGGDIVEPVDYQPIDLDEFRRNAAIERERKAEENRRREHEQFRRRIGAV